jgi:hypothetical protein
MTTKNFALISMMTMLLPAFVPVAFGQATVSALATSQPLLGWWQQEFDAWAIEICNHQGGIDRDVAAKIVCNGKTVTLYFREEVVSFPVTESEDLSGRNTALLAHGGATLLIGFKDGKVYGWQFERAGDRIYYSNRIKPSQSK